MAFLDPMMKSLALSSALTNSASGWKYTKLFKQICSYLLSEMVNFDYDFGFE